MIQQLAAAAVERVEGDVRITGVKAYDVRFHRPKMVGKNARLDIHGDSGGERFVELATSAGVTGVGWANADEATAAKMLGTRPADWFKPDRHGFVCPLGNGTAPLWDLLGKLDGRPVYELLAGKGGPKGPEKVRGLRRLDLLRRPAAGPRRRLARAVQARDCDGPRGGPHGVQDQDRPRREVDAARRRRCARRRGDPPVPRDLRPRRHPRRRREQRLRPRRHQAADGAGRPAEPRVHRGDVPRNRGGVRRAQGVLQGKGLEDAAGRRRDAARHGSVPAAGGRPRDRRAAGRHPALRVRGDGADVGDGGRRRGEDRAAQLGVDRGATT